MTDYIYIGSCPIEENCLQVGQVETNFLKTECCIFKRQLERELKPQHITFIVKGENHDFGKYFEVCARFDDSNPDAVNEAFDAESNTPLVWDNEAKAELQILYQQIKAQ